MSIIHHLKQVPIELIVGLDSEMIYQRGVSGREGCTYIVTCLIDPPDLSTYVPRLLVERRGEIQIMSFPCEEVQGTRYDGQDVILQSVIRRE